MIMHERNKAVIKCALFGISANLLLFIGKLITGLAVGSNAVVLDAVNSLSGVAQAYVLNQRTKKFHHPDCSGIRDMNPKNREDFTGTRDEVLAMGYSPCGICKP